MENFNLERNGYDKREVEEYVDSIKRDYEQTLSEQKNRISELKKELEENKQELSKYVEKSNNISDALVVAVETAKQIENSSKNIYDLEIKRIRALYSKWEQFLDQMMQEYPRLRDRFDTKALLKVFSDGIDNVIKQNSVTVPSSPSNAMGLRNLINKMSNFNAKQEPAVDNTLKHTIIKPEVGRSYYNDNLTSIGTVPQQTENVVDRYQELRMEQLRRQQEQRAQAIKNAEALKTPTPVRPVVEEKPVVKVAEERFVKEPEPVKVVVSPKPEPVIVKEEPVVENKNILIRKEKPTAVEEPAEKKTKIKSISSLTLNNDEKFENLVDKFLSVDEDEEIVADQYEKAVLNKKNKESGFDLSEALNPTDDLSEIMKSFDAFNDSLFDVDPEGNE